MAGRFVRDCDRCEKEIGECKKEDLGREMFIVIAAKGSPVADLLEKAGVGHSWQLEDGENTPAAHRAKSQQWHAGYNDMDEKCQATVLNLIARIFKIKGSDGEAGTDG